MSDNPPRSAFATALTRVLNALGSRRTHVAVWLGVSVSAIEHWECDWSLPSPENLQRLVSILRDTVPPENPEARKTFEADIAEFSYILTVRSSLVTPLAKAMIGSPGHYMLSGMRDQAIAALSTVPVRVQEEILLRVLEACGTYQCQNEGQYPILQPARPAIPKF